MSELACDDPELHAEDEVCRACGGNRSVPCRCGGWACVCGVYELPCLWCQE